MSGPEGNEAIDVGVLVLAHTEPELLELLIERLSTDFTLYVHVDKSAPQSVRDVVERHNVRTVPSRSTYWGSFHTVLATLDLLDLAKGQGHSHFLLMSGQDLPLLTNDELKRFLAENKSIDFIDAAPLTPSDVWGGTARIARPHWKAFWRHSGAMRGLYWLVDASLELLYRTVLQRKVLAGEFFGGATWFCLTHTTANKVLNYIETNPDFVNLFKRSRIGDEIFLPTIVGRLDAVGLTRKPSPTFNDWQTGPDKPRILDSSDMPRLEQTWHPIARKINRERSKALIDRYLGA